MLFEIPIIKGLSKESPFIIGIFYDYFSLFMLMYTSTISSFTLSIAFEKMIFCVDVSVLWIVMLFWIRDIK